MRSLLSLSLTVSLWTSLVLAAQPVRNLHVTLRGKKYDIDDDVTTVKDLQERVKEVSGVDSATKTDLLFGGKRLSSSDVLSEVGVSNGAELSLVPSTETSATKKKKTADTGATAVDSNSNFMKEYLEQSGVDPTKLEEMMKEMGSGEMPSIEESMKAMQSMMNSPIFQEYMNDPEKLEQSRQMILDNPMLKSMMVGMPGMEELLNDKDAWRDAMQAAANLYKNMDQDTLLKAMSGQAGPGLFDGTLDQSSAAKALNELEEDD